MKQAKMWLLLAATVLLLAAVQPAWCGQGSTNPQATTKAADGPPESTWDDGAKYVILLISDGWGCKHIEATNNYTGSVPDYQSWTCYFMATWDLNVQTYHGGVGYDPDRAWSEFGYVSVKATDSASAATAMYTGIKTDNGNICTSHADAYRLLNISEIAKDLGMASGAISSVQVSHATPGCWYAHNDHRGNGYAIADEGFWGDPLTTGLVVTDLLTGKKYGGSHGPTFPTPDVLIGAGHPYWDTSYVNRAQRYKLAVESGTPGCWTFLERVAGSPDGGARLLAAAYDPQVTKLAGLFGGKGGNFEYRLADGSGFDPENPTLADCTGAALQVLGRNSNGFVLMVEGGAVDWAGHANNMDWLVGEQIDFDNSVQKVIDWVEDPNNGSDWDNTLIIVTGDHECGYLTAGPGVFADTHIAEVSQRTLALEKEYNENGRRASWEDLNENSRIDDGETVYWAFNSGDHTNQLIPLYVRGAGSELFEGFALGHDPVRGAYIDNTNIFDVMSHRITD